MHCSSTKLLGLSTLLLASRLFGSSVSASCTSYGFAGTPQQTVVNTGTTAANCQLPTVNQVSAMAQVTLQLAGNAAGWSGLDTNQNTLAYSGPGDPIHPLGANTEADTAISYQDLLTTAGPLRAGYLQWMGNGGGFEDFGHLGMTTGIVSTSPYSPITEMNCHLDCTPGPGYYNVAYPRIPFLLGVPFTLEAVGATDAGASEGVGGVALIQTDYQFRFFEADGVTPVAVSETPEPSSVALCSLAGAVLAFRLRRRQKS